MRHRSKAARLKNKKAKQALPGLAETPRRAKQGRARMQEIEDNQVAYKARARQMGETDSAKMKDPMLGFDAGRALWNDKDRQDLWKTYDECFRAYRRYMFQKTGLSLDAKTAKIEMMPERFETNADDTPRDDRTDEERHKSAMDAWDTWERALSSLPMAQSASVYSALHGWSTLVTYSGWPTKQGAAFIEAVKALHSAVEGGA